MVGPGGERKQMLLGVQMATVTAEVQKALNLAGDARGRWSSASCPAVRPNRLAFQWGRSSSRSTRNQSTCQPTCRARHQRRRKRPRSEVELLQPSATVERSVTLGGMADGGSVAGPVPPMRAPPPSQPALPSVAPSLDSQEAMERRIGELERRVAELEAMLEQFTQTAPALSISTRSRLLSACSVTTLRHCNAQRYEAFLTRRTRADADGTASMSPQPEAVTELPFRGWLTCFALAVACRRLGR